MDSENVSQNKKEENIKNKSKGNFNDIRSSYIMKIILSYLQTNK